MANIIRVTEEHIINDKGFSNPYWFFSSSQDLDPAADVSVPVPTSKHRKNHRTDRRYTLFVIFYIIYKLFQKLHGDLLDSFNNIL
jgi:hypothetical protein